MNTNNRYQVYREQTSKLAKTLVIKIPEIADAINAGLELKRIPVDYSRPETWKYYMNICGQYHPSDTVMTVISMDTLEQITFSKENLVIHRATAREYQYGTKKYLALVRDYPNQQTLIKGILYPADMDTALAADWGTILSYPPDLIQDNEYSLVANLEDWIRGWYARWFNSQYTLSDELYLTTWYGIMIPHLFLAIPNFRLAACRTNEAHSFHVYEFLASHSKLDPYVEQMTLKQALWFYRNIEWIEHNSGTQDTFADLVQHIMTERNLPIGEYVMRHDVSVQPAEIYSAPFFKKTAINEVFSADVKSDYSLGELLDKEAPIAPSNQEVREDEEPVISRSLRNSRSNVVMTKALESHMADYSNSERYPLEQILTDHWLFLSTEGIYTAYVGVVNPRTQERIPLTAKETYIFMLYVFCKSIGFELSHIPLALAGRVQRIPTPTTDDLMKVVNEKYISRDLADYVIGLQPTIEAMISTEAFYNKCVEIHDASNWQYNVVAYQEHQYARGLMHGMISQLYSTNVVRLEEDNYSYGQWFAERNIIIGDFPINDQPAMNTLYKTIVSEATGMNLTTTNSVANLQKAMVSMISQLSSYAIQFMSEINNSVIQKLGWGMIRLGDIKTKLENTIWLDTVDAQVQDLYIGMLNSLHYSVSGMGFGEDLKITMQNTLRLEIDVAPKFGKNPLQFSHFMDIGGTRIRFTSPLLPNERDIIPVFGLDTYLAASREDQAKIEDMYGNKWYYDIPVDRDLAVAIRVNHLNGLFWYIEEP